MTSGTEHTYTRTEYHLWEEKQEQEDGKGKKFRGKNKRTRRRKKRDGGGGGGGGGGECTGDTMLCRQTHISSSFWCFILCVTRGFSLICICLNS